ncbi:copper resistance D family protein [Amycolatopsis sp. NPDC098790]|uniref:copper resistance D family protein n=1 Tax=Amycolatopsis sp. NPDC098790 TaxID=3363939 RepID=UPI0038061E84
MSFLLAQVPAAVANPTPAPWRVITKMAYFAGLIGTIGATMLHLLVLRPVLNGRTVDGEDRAVLRRRTSLLLAAAGTWYLVALYFQIAGKAARVKGADIPYGRALEPASIWKYVTVPAKKGEWVSSGALTLTQYALWAASAAVLMLLWSPRLRGHLTAIAASGLVLSFVAYQVTLLPTDFGKETADALVDGLLDHLHVSAVSTWVGGIASLVVLATARRRLTPRAGETWARIWTRFSTVALCAVGCVLISGLYLAWSLVGSPGELLSTSFGRFLLVKVSLVATMIAVGGLNEFVLMPRIARARAAGEEGSVFRLALRVFPGLVAVEAALAVGVLFVLSFLTGSARVEAGDPDPTLSGGIVGIGVLLAVLLAISFVTTAKVSERLSRPAVAPAAEPVPEF